MQYATFLNLCHVLDVVQLFLIYCGRCDVQIWDHIYQYNLVIFKIILLMALAFLYLQKSLYSCV